MQARVRSGRFQNDLNLLLGVSTVQSASPGGTGASVGSATSAGGAVGSVIGGTGGGGGYGGGGGEFECFAGDTPILMANGSIKPIRETLLYADVVAVPDENGKLEAGRINYRTETMFHRWIKITFEDGRIVEVRPNHRYRDDAGGWVMASHLEYSFHLDETAHWVKCKVLSIELIEHGELDFYNIGVGHSAHAYVAHGDWVSNRKPRLEGYDTF